MIKSLGIVTLQGIGYYTYFGVSKKFVIHGSFTN